MNVSVSVIVPIYNAEMYMRNAIESLINQTITDIEIILINDGSTDHSGEIADGFADVDNRIKVIHKKNGGVSSARNAGLEFASGDYIAFLDPDDYIDQDAYGELYTLAKEKKLDTIIFDSINITKSEKYVMKRNLPKNKTMLQREIRSYIIRDLVISDNNASCWNKFIKRDFLIKNNIYFDNTLSLGEDYLFNLKLFSYTNRIFYLPESYYKYVTNVPDSLVKKFNPKYFNIQRKIYLYKLEKLPEWDLEDEKVALAEFFLYKVVKSIINEFSVNNSDNLVLKIKTVINIVNDKKVIEAATIFPFKSTKYIFAFDMFNYIRNRHWLSLSIISIYYNSKLLTLVKLFKKISFSSQKFIKRLRL